MSPEQLANILKSLLHMPAENEVVEFKKAANGFDDHQLGQ